MEYQYLNTIEYPSDLKKLPVEALPRVCDEVRDFIINSLSHNPGHLASSLGTVELTVALHYVYNTPEDRILWDVGHQAYAHKILTGRRERFSTNRQFKGLAPFPTPAESEYDAFVAGHASNSISAALGEDVGKNLNPLSEGKDETEKRKVVAVIGDGAMTGGLAFEGLNNTSMTKNDLLIVLNDNNMAIDPIRGGFTQYLLDLTTSTGYNHLRWELYKLAKRMHLIDDRSKGKVQRLNNSLKAVLTKQPKNIFSSLNLRYFGPADGHNVTDLVRILTEIKDYKGPRVLHIVTKKGKGYAPAEQDQTLWHAPGEFNVESGERITHDQRPPLWQEVFGNTLLELAKEDSRVVGITPAMLGGCSMNIMQQAFPERVFDVGIAEGHAVTFSAGLAKEGMIPFCNIYSSFLQRAYDSIIHDVALQNLHVVLCIDRAGIVGADGATHHGLLDLAYLRPIPNMTIGAPMDADDLKKMMRYALTFNGPIAIRYPRGCVSANPYTLDNVEITKARCLREGKDMAVLSIGAIGNEVAKAIDLLHKPADEETNHCGQDASVSIAHYDMRWLKPLDTEVLDYIGTHFDRIITAEDGMTTGGLGSAVLEYFADKGYHCQVERLGIKDQFVEHGSTKELYHMLGLDAEGIERSIKKSDK